jgi:hypothetical protein
MLKSRFFSTSSTNTKPVPLVKTNRPHRRLPCSYQYWPIRQLDEVLKQSAPNPHAFGTRPEHTHVESMRTPLAISVCNSAIDMYGSCQRSAGIADSLMISYATGTSVGSHGVIVFMLKSWILHLEITFNA